ncbi:hypothetical protein KC320_g143 [Hortaea werneckii]|nr:hypothetical protein KC320_g143 [Hortaea werneckii]
MNSGGSAEVRAKAPIAVEVDGAERSHVQPSAFAVEVDLPQVTALPGTLRDGGFGVGRVALREFGLEAGTDDEPFRISCFVRNEHKLIVLARSFGVLMFDQKAIAGRLNVVIAWDLRRHECRGRDVTDMAGRVDDGDVNCVL